MIIDQFFAYLSAISLLESTGQKKKNRDICMLFRKLGANIVVKTPGGGDSRNIQDMKRFIDLQL